MHAARSHSARYFSFISICAATILMVYSFVYDIHTYMYEYGKCLFVFFQQIAGINICCFCCSWVLLFATFKCFTFNFLTADCFQHIGCCCCHFFCAIFHYSTACCVLFVAPCYCCCRFRASVLNLQMFSCIAAISFRVHALTDTNICLCMCVRMHILCTVKQAQVAITAFL